MCAGEETCLPLAEEGGGEESDKGGIKFK